MCWLCCGPSLERCSRCTRALYCSRACQAGHFPAHRGACARLACSPLELPEDPRAALAVACAAGSLDGVRSLLEGLSAPAARDLVCAARLPAATAGGGGGGWLAVHCALAHGHPALARLLVESYGADINARSLGGASPGATPMALLLARGWPAIASAALRALRPDCSPSVCPAAGAALRAACASADAAADAPPARALCAALLAAGADAGGADGEGLTPLHLAAARGHVGIMAALLAGGARLPEAGGAQAECAAAAAAAAAAARARSEAAAARAAQREGEAASGSSSEEEAAGRGAGAAAGRAAAAARARAPRAAAPEPPPRPRAWLHPIHCAIAGGRPGAVAALLDAHGTPLGLLQPGSGDSLLHAAARARAPGAAAVLELLLERVAAAKAAAAGGEEAGGEAAAQCERAGALGEAACDEAGALGDAAGALGDDAGALLEEWLPPRGPLAPGRLLEHTNAEGCTPLVAAIACGEGDAALALLRAGASARAAGPRDLAQELPDALACAVAGGSGRLVAALAGAGADLRARNASGDCALAAAAAAGALGPLAALLAAGADARARAPPSGETPLHALAQRSEDGASADAAAPRIRHGGGGAQGGAQGGAEGAQGGAGAGAPHDSAARIACAEALLAAGAEVNARTALGGHTPLWLAAFHGSPRLAACLAAAGGDPTILDDGRNPSLAAADAYAAPALNEGRRAYARSPQIFARECAETAEAIRRAWLGRQGGGVAREAA